MLTQLQTLGGVVIRTETAGVSFIFGSILVTP